jgi:hypothetical protein
MHHFGDIITMNIIKIKFTFLLFSCLTTLKLLPPPLMRFHTRVLTLLKGHKPVPGMVYSLYMECNTLPSLFSLCTLDDSIIMLRVVRPSVCACVRAGRDWKSFDLSENVFFLGIAGLGTLQQTAYWHGWLWPKPWVKWAASKGRRGRIRLKCTLTCTFWWPGECKRETFWSRCCPYM